MPASYATDSSRFLNRFGTISSNGLRGMDDESAELVLCGRINSAMFLQECFGTISSNGLRMAELAEFVLCDRSELIMEGDALCLLL